MPLDNQIPIVFFSKNVASSPQLDDEYWGSSDSDDGEYTPADREREEQVMCAHSLFLLIDYVLSLLRQFSVVII